VSGFLGVLAAGGSGLVINPLAAGNSNGQSSVGTNATGRVRFLRNGTINYSGVVSEVGTGGPAAWSGIPSATVGDSVFIKCTVTSGTLTANPATTPTVINTTLSFDKGPILSDASATCTFDFYSDVGGTVLLCSSPGWTIQTTHV
jgi:hypothetical protein